MSSHSEPITTDIAIIGAGPAGLSLACMLADSGLAITLIEQQALDSLANPANDGREIALSHKSIQLLKNCGAWSFIDPNEIYPLQDAAVQDDASPVILALERGDDNDLPLGYFVSNRRIRAALYRRVSELNNITVLANQSVNKVSNREDGCLLCLASGQEIACQLTVAADSRFSNTRRSLGIGAQVKDFGRTMLLVRMQHEADHQQRAQEWFRQGRNCAILPLAAKQSSIVLTMPTVEADKVKALEGEAFNKKVEALMDSKLGRMEKIADVFSYPLMGVYAEQFVATRFALVGDAAVGMHPSTAHGYNLGLRSANSLSELIKTAKRHNEDIAADLLLEKYQFNHRLAAKPLYESTNMIVDLFTSNNPVAKVARKSILSMGNKLAPVKSLVLNKLLN